MRRFAEEVRRELVADGWHVAEVPPGVTLAGLRASGAPFRGSKYFDSQAQSTRELPVGAGEVAYRAGLLPGSLNRTFGECGGLVTALAGTLPPGARPVIGPAALYAWLFVEHHRQSAAWPISGCYTWAADEAGAGAAHLAVGVFGRDRPLVISPIPEASGRGIGVLPLVLPEL